MKLLTDAAASSLAASGGRPIVLVTLMVPHSSGSTTYRFASQSDGDGSGGYRIGGSGDVYAADLVTVERIVRALPRSGGIVDLAGGAVALCNPDSSGGLWSDSLLVGSLDRARCAVELIFADGSETADDAIMLGEGAIGTPEIDVRAIELPLDGDTAMQSLPVQRRAEPSDYANAPETGQGRIRPVVLGDLTGSAFDISIPSDGVFPHVPLPTLNAQRQRVDLFDDTTGGSRETILELYDQLIQVADSAVTFGSGYLQIDGNEFDLWLRPHRVDLLTSGGVIDPENACTNDLSRAATCSAGTALYLNLPGASSALGGLGAATTLVAGDVTVYTVYSKVNSSDTNPGQVTIRLNGTGITGHVGVNLNGAGVSVDSQQIGNHLTSWDDLRHVSVLVNGVGGTSGVYVHRILARVVFRCDEVRAAFDQQRVYRSMQGFTEDGTSALTDYQDGGYLRGARLTSPVSHPADISEAIYRHREWGLGMSATSLADSGADLNAVTYPDLSTCVVDVIGSIVEGDVLLIDHEAVRVTDISGTTLTIDRGVAGSRPACHVSGADVYRLGDTGDIDSASFRGAVGVLHDTDDTEIVANGAMEGSYVSGVAPSWSEYDPSGIGTPTSCDGYTGEYAQQIERTGSGTHPGVSQSLTGLVVGEWYRVSFYARATAGEVALQCSVVQTQSLHPDFTVDTAWSCVSFDFPSTGTTATLRLRNAGATDDILQFDGASVQRLVSWRLDFALTDAVDTQEWLNDVLLPQSGLRIGRDEHGRVYASARMRGRDAVATLDASDIVLGSSGVPLISATRTPTRDVSTGMTVRYGRNHLTNGYNGVVTVEGSRRHTGETISSIASGSPLDTITVDDSSALAPKDSAVEGSAIAVSGLTVTFPSGDLVNAGVAPGDWAVVGVGGVTCMHQVASVSGATQLDVVDRPPQFNAAGQWSVGDNVYVAGTEIFGVCETPTGTTATVFRGLDDVNLTAGTGMAADDAVWRLSSRSDDGLGVADQGAILYAARERASLLRMARHAVARTQTFDAPYIRDRQTALFLRNRLFDDGDRAWIVTVTTDLSTLALDVGDTICVEHEMLPDGAVTGEIIHQAVDPIAGLIEYVVQGEE